MKIHNTNITTFLVRCLQGKNLLLFLPLLIAPIADPAMIPSQNGKVIEFTPIQIPYEEDDLTSPGRGVEQWHNDNVINVSSLKSNPTRLDVYYRFTWNKIELDQNIYTWDYFDALINEAIKKRQKFSFGIMTCFPDGKGNGILFYDGGCSAYPEYLHKLMQKESVTDWKSDGTAPTNGNGFWVPNYNSKYYLDRLSALYKALNDHIESNSFENIKYKDVIGYIDVRGYGSWGEWHQVSVVGNVNKIPPGARASTATLKKIIDAHTENFVDFPLVTMIAAFDGERLPTIMNSAEVGYYALTTRNKWGLLGWRKDQWGATDRYLSDFLEQNNKYFRDIPLNKLIMERWKYAPIVGEPPGWGNYVNGCMYGDLERQIRLYHASSFGNGNYGTKITDCMIENIKAASKASGYRILIEKGTITNGLKQGSPFTVTMNWKNIGVAPPYEKWNVIFQLKDSSGATRWSGLSKFEPQFFLPDEKATTITDHFTLTDDLEEGYYSFNVIIKDPKNYRYPLPLAIKNRNSDGSYTLKSLFLKPGN